MIIEYENTLRRIISHVIGIKDDSKFCISSDRVNKWTEKREIESKKYNGINFETRIIYYSDFYDLKTIILKNWEKFKDILDSKKKFEVHFEQMETFRNTISHGRSLFVFQEKMIEGIVGELKTSIINYHNKNMNPSDYFVKIMKVSDSIGNIWEEESGSIGMITQSVLQVGDYIEINIEAFDPKGREIVYEIYNSKFCFTNNDGKFQLEITNAMIGYPMDFLIIVKTLETSYENTDHVSVHYIVIPKD
ncbi:MAG: hypothetical protein Q7V19_03770 [Bacteroidales bacterium]|nr:hypothetical protein [Bacteroidales bacterium]